MAYEARGRNAWNAQIQEAWHDSQSKEHNRLSLYVDK